MSVDENPPVDTDEDLEEQLKLLLVAIAAVEEAGIGEQPNPLHNI